jgi:hypothetical protein
MPIWSAWFQLGYASYQSLTDGGKTWKIRTLITGETKDNNRSSDRLTTYKSAQFTWLCSWCLGDTHPGRLCGNIEIREEGQGGGGNNPNCSTTTCRRFSPGLHVLRSIRPWPLMLASSVLTVQLLHMNGTSETGNRDRISITHTYTLPGYTRLF